MANKLTLLIDGGWMLQSRVFAIEKGFSINNSDFQKRAAADELKSLLARSITKIINQVPEIDNIVLMSEGGSWRKALPIPKQLENITYKGQRVKRSELDWKAIFSAYGEFAQSCSDAGVTVSQHPAIEGDDWAWYWSRRLNAQGTSVIIWTSDCDLKQLVQSDGITFTAWYNDKAGLVLPKNMEWPEDPIEAMLMPPAQPVYSDNIVNRLGAPDYIWPGTVVINKVLCGDAGDNIKACFRYQKGSRTYRFTESDYKKLVDFFKINNVHDFIEVADDIAKHIAESSKFEQYGADAAKIREMIEYNLKLVWLNESVLPETVTKAMVATEYKEFNINDLRHNHKLLLNSNSNMANLFDSI